MNLVPAHKTAEAARPGVTMPPEWRLGYGESTGHELWRLLLRRALTGSGCFISAETYASILPAFGSSSLFVDRRQTRPRVQSRFASSVRTEIPDYLVWPIEDKMRNLAAALSLNKSQLARILGVTRPTVYSWLQGKEPDAANTGRLHTLLRSLSLASVSGTMPLNARFVRQRPETGEPSLLELLSEEEPASDRIVEALKAVRRLGDLADQEQAALEERLRSRGFEEPDAVRRREQLAKNMALKPWPK